MGQDAESKRYSLVSPAPDETPTLVPARMINEVLYCERLAYLEWVQGEFADNAFTVEGRAVHRRVDRPGRPLEPPVPAETGDDDPGETRGVQDDRPYVARSVWLSSERLGITGKVDIVEVEEGSVIPIEYKRGKQPDVPEGA
jgi:CRISPR/Cas system-associated exonuclease Cas4 (RecB family)